MVQRWVSRVLDLDLSDRHWGNQLSSKGIGKARISGAGGSGGGESNDSNQLWLKRQRRRRRRRHWCDKGENVRTAPPPLLRTFYKNRLVGRSGSWATGQLRLGRAGKPLTGLRDTKEEKKRYKMTGAEEATTIVHYSSLIAIPWKNLFSCSFNISFQSQTFVRFFSKFLFFQCRTIEREDSSVASLLQIGYDRVE